MVFLMARPAKVSGSRFPYARKVIPAALRAILGQSEFKRPLRALEPAEIRRLHREAMADFEARIEAARAKAGGNLRSLNAREIAGLCGVRYREALASHEREPGDAMAWEATRDALLEVVACEPDQAPPDMAPTADDIAKADAWLFGQGIAADAETVRRMAVGLWTAEVQVAETMIHRAKGDWHTDHYLPRFPVALIIAPPAAVVPPSSTAALTFTALVAAWAAERQPPEKSRAKWAATFAGLAEIIGHDDTKRVTVEDARQWKQARLGQGRALKTVADGIAVMRSTFNWAIKNGLLPEKNPFTNMAPKLPKHGIAARDGYTDVQAAQVLQAAREQSGWLRWLPWLMCFTGARVGEIADLRRRDVRQEGGVWIVDIVPTATRGLKTDQAQRMVPLHPAVLAEGFLLYVEATPADGPLWPDLRPAFDGTRGTAATKAHSRWIRNSVGITDTRIAPAHSFRHRMEDQLRKVRAAPEAQDAITGHNHPRNAGAGYGRGFRGMPDELLKELERVPLPTGLMPCDPTSQGPRATPAPARTNRVRRSRRRPPMVPSAPV